MKAIDRDAGHLQPLGELDGHIFKFYDHWHEANRHVHYYYFRNIASGFSATHLGHC